MTSSLCIEELRRSANNPFPSIDVCQTLKAEHGISIISAADRYIVERTAAPGRAPFRYLIGKEVGHLVGPMVALLDPSAAKGLVQVHIRNEIMACANKHGDYEWASKALSLNSQREFLQAVLIIAEHNSCDFKTIWERVKNL